MALDTHADGRVQNALRVLADHCALIGRDLEAGRLDALEAGRCLEAEVACALERCGSAARDAQRRRTSPAAVPDHDDGPTHA